MQALQLQNQRGSTCIKIFEKSTTQKTNKEFRLLLPSSIVVRFMNELPILGFRMCLAVYICLNNDVKYLLYLISILMQATANGRK
jgi:hypothetical protein